MINKIRELVSKNRLTQEQFAKAIGKTKQTINNYYSGRTKIDVETLELIAKVLRVPVYYFFDGGEQLINPSSKDKDLEICQNEIVHLKKEIELKDTIISMLTKQNEMKS